MADHKLKREENVERFLNNLYSDICTEARWSDELPDIIGATREMVNKIVTEFKLSNMEELKSEGVINIDVSDAGSMAEGTSICNPDEFDFVISFTYSSEETLPPSNEIDIRFADYTVKPKDPRFRRINKGLNKEPFLAQDFMVLNFRRLKSALLKVSEKGPIRRGQNKLCLDIISYPQKFNYGMQGPAFSLQKAVRWVSPKRIKDLIISVDLVPTIVIYDENFTGKIPDLKNGCSCEEHLIYKPDHFFLLPVKSRHYVLEMNCEIVGDGKHQRAKRDFIRRNYIVSLSGYESDIMKTWKCEKSIYHNWFICYKLMKCFGDLDNTPAALVHPLNGGLVSQISYLTFPERENDKFSSYTWKTLVLRTACKATSKLTLKQCFDRLTAMFDKENLFKYHVLHVKCFWLPLETSETIHLKMRNKQCYTQYVKRMTQLKVILNEMIYDPKYEYLDYRTKIKNIFPKLASYFPGKGNGKVSASDCKSKL